MDPIPITKTLPTAVSEDKAIAIAKDYAERYKKLCLIKYSSIKNIVIKPTGEVFTEYFHPNIEVNDKYIIPGTANEKVGKVYLK